ncbi:MAG: hypothetical protein H6657_25205 [Ardenticatenaceae bacterium]|nr:hypothetical protein [Ardenticatenaceae bacterium]
MCRASAGDAGGDERPSVPGAAVNGDNSSMRVRFGMLAGRDALVYVDDERCMWGEERPFCHPFS